MYLIVNFILTPELPKLVNRNFLTGVKQRIFRNLNVKYRKVGCNSSYYKYFPIFFTLMPLMEILCFSLAGSSSVRP